jgi:outer membrane biosynthesis protein TonB
MKLRLLLIVAVSLLLVPNEWAAATDLSRVRTGKHENFARVVFEFQNAVQFKSPEIKGKGKFSLVFLNSTTKLPHLTVYKTGKTQVVQSIEYVRENSNLTAIVRLTFPYFILKSYALSAPDRIVVDAYWVTAPPENSEQKASLTKESISAPSSPPGKKEITKSLQKTAEKPVPESSITPQPVKKPLLNESKTSQTASSIKKSNQMPEEKKITPAPASKGNNMAQTYLLVILDVIAGCIVVLFIFTLFRKKQTINIGHLCEILDFIKTSDQRIAAINDQIKIAFEKYDQF